MRTQVVIIGAGPAGLLLGHLLHRAGIDAIILEQRSADYVRQRVRAGVLEQGTVDILDRLGVSQRLHAEGLEHDGIELGFGGKLHRIDFRQLIGRTVTIYGQSEITRDLMDASAQLGLRTIHEVESVALQDFHTDAPRVRFLEGGATREIECEFIAGCDGFHGVCRRSVPGGSIRAYERVYPFGWLGVLSQTPPVGEELIYVNSQRGFALCSMRSAVLSRYYVQCPLQDHVDEWPDSRFWDELKRRLGEALAARLVTGPAIEKSIVPLRSLVVEPLRFGRLFLAGDAAHIVPPTGAKGLNLAASDVRYLAEALQEYYRDRSAAALDEYSRRCLQHVWKAVRFSWWMTTQLHRFPETDEFGERMQQSELEYLAGSRAAQASLAENYAGLPPESSER